jgi:hypothetical protein
VLNKLSIDNPSAFNPKECGRFGCRFGATRKRPDFWGQLLTLHTVRVDGKMLPSWSHGVDWQKGSKSHFQKLCMFEQIAALPGLGLGRLVNRILTGAGQHVGKGLLAAFLGVQMREAVIQVGCWHRYGG